MTGAYILFGLFLAVFALLVFVSRNEKKPKIGDDTNDAARGYYNSRSHM